MTPVEILCGMRNLLERPEAWAQSGWAYDKNGRRLTDPDSPDAVSWCLEGARRRVCGWDKLLPINISISSELACHFLMAATNCGGSHLLWDFNDARGRTHGEILAAIDKAIQLAKAAEESPS